MSGDITTIAELYAPRAEESITDEGLVVRARLRGLFCAPRTNERSLWVLRLHLVFADNTDILLMTRDLPQGRKDEQAKLSKDALSPYTLDDEYLIELYPNHLTMLLATDLPNGNAAQSLITC